ncbi:M42 family metallopeptidase [Thermoflavimicrobium dichotomicum]|uniref:Putative aminopeptidase FrvX n=1 Tax=Thermoflavimicrobium dichotomicum TaxID=46223 RepID=A0A1I3L597_9BACL|nr:M42 family metallopeptidase [Thermoflavimicrobium dichotomicum]SFI79924.1 Putative aminopeptidase FrvX [Thermoflavimicrobium dichotomicum]
MDRLTQMMKVLTEAEGIPGYEHEVRKVMEEYLSPLSDELLRDQLGGVVGKKAGNPDGPRILLAGHLDEIGFIVTHITDKGYLRFQQLGGWWTHTLLSQRVKVKTKKGDYIGLVGSKPPHVLKAEERKKVLELKDLFIDVGAKSREDAEEMGIRLGDPIVPVSEFFTMRNDELWVGKAIDNRAGCALAIEVLNRLQNEEHPNVVYAGATVQEEVGLRGAQTLANLVQPDIAFALDVGIANDTPGSDQDQSPNYMGEGPVITLADASMIGHPELRRLVMDVAEEKEIPVQLEVLMGGGTDGGKFHISGTGCPTVVIGFATRYIHSHNAIMSRRDFEQAATLLTEVIKRLNRETVDQITYR